MVIDLTNILAAFHRKGHTCHLSLCLTMSSLTAVPHVLEIHIQVWTFFYNPATVGGLIQVPLLRHSEVVPCALQSWLPRCVYFRQHVETSCWWGIPTSGHLKVVSSQVVEPIILSGSFRNKEIVWLQSPRQLISFAYSKNRKLWHENFVGGRSVYEEVMSLPCSLRFLPSIRRAYSTTGCDQPIICIPPGSRVYAFGSASQSGTPLIQDFDWTVQDGEAWVVISGTGKEKTNIFKVSITFLVHILFTVILPKVDSSWPH